MNFVLVGSFFKKIFVPGLVSATILAQGIHLPAIHNTTIGLTGIHQLTAHRTVEELPMPVTLTLTSFNPQLEQQPASMPSATGIPTQLYLHRRIPAGMASPGLALIRKRMILLVQKTHDGI